MSGVSLISSTVDNLSLILSFLNPLMLLSPRSISLSHLLCRPPIMFSPTYSWAVLLSHNPHSFILSSICKSPGRELTGGGDMLCREVTGSRIVAYIASSECLFNNTLISIYILSAGCHDSPEGGRSVMKSIEMPFHAPVGGMRDSSSPKGL